MRVAIFFDGKNYTEGWRRQPEGLRDQVDIEKLAQWLVQRVGGASLWGAYYYTGIEPRLSMDTSGEIVPDRLTAYLTKLEYLPGFFVRRLRRADREYRCHACGELNVVSQEKEVDTTMVADMLRFAAVDAFDVLVLVSGDADHAPAVEGVRELGKKVYVASWGRVGMAHRLIRAAFDHVDLRASLPGVLMNGASAGPIGDVAARAPTPPAQGTAAQPIAAAERSPATTPSRSSYDREAFLDELVRAERQFSSGYVGVNYFLRNWRSMRLDPDFDARKAVLESLLAIGSVEVYEAPDGSKALRVVERTPESDDDAVGSESADPHASSNGLPPEQARPLPPSDASV